MRCLPLSLAALSLSTLSLAFATPALAETVTGTAGTELEMTELETFDGAWAMTFLPDGRALVTEKDGRLWLLGRDGKKIGRITGLPETEARGQGGLGDIILHPDFTDNSVVFLSYVEREKDNDDLSGAAVTRAKLSLSSRGGSLSDKAVIWRQAPKMRGNGHYGHRMAFGPNDGLLYITSGERQHFTPSQNMDMNLGKVVRIREDGSIPEDNPFADQSGVTREIWSLGHRNPLGIDFDAAGQLWVHEMGPRDGDELNRVLRGENYGYPVVSNGKHYSGKHIPDHSEFPIYENPAAYWVPAISPAGFVIYDDDAIPAFTGDGFIGGLSSQALIRIVFDADKVAAVADSPAKTDMRTTLATEAERFEWGRRIREVEQGPEGALYVLEDGEGRLLKLTAK